jgi:hypothetical protein
MAWCYGLMTHTLVYGDRGSEGRMNIDDLVLVSADDRVVEPPPARDRRPPGTQPGLRPAGL